MRQSKKNLLTACTLLFAYTSFSQINVDSLLQNQSQSKTEMVARARATLIDAFVANDKQKVQGLHSYIAENFEQSDYIALFPNEQVLLYAWCGNFETMLAYLQKADSAYLAKQRKKIGPPYTYNFYETLNERIRQESESILNSVQASPLSQEEKDFVTIYLRYYLIDETYYSFWNFPYHSPRYPLNEKLDSTIRQINVDTRKFTTSYPNSEYTKLFNSYEFKPSDWGWGMGVNFGYAAKTGNFSKSFKNEGNFDLHIDVAYKKYMAAMGIIATFGDARKDIVKSNELTLPKDTSIKVYNFYGTFGYRFFDNNRIIVTPTVGIGTAWIRPGTAAGRKNDPTLKKFDYSYGLTTNFGVAADIRLGKMKKILGQDFVAPTFFAVRLSYKFSYNTLKHTPTFYDGNIHTITVGFYMFGRNIKPVKYK